MLILSIVVHFVFFSKDIIKTVINDRKYMDYELQFYRKW